MSITAPQAQMIAALVHALPEKTCADLHRLLAYSLAAPTPSELREARLGLLMELIRGLGGRVPRVSDYDRLRTRRARLAESWPSHSQLIRAYGNWLSAVGAALKLDQGLPGVSYRAPRPPRRYTNEALLNAIDLCALSTGGLPTESDYRDWARLTKEAEHRYGCGRVAVPGSVAIRRRFGTWSSAIRAASRRAKCDGGHSRPALTPH